MAALADLNRDFRDRYALESDIAARTKAYELAARMQLSAPEAVDISGEPEHVLDLYGIGDAATEEFGRQLLLARRLAERGVRFIQVCHAGGGNGGWDAHGDIRTHAPLCRATDKPIAGLIRDLKTARPARPDPRRLDQRVRPEPLVAEHDGPRPQPEGLHGLARRRRRQGRHRPWRHRRGRLQGGREPALLQRPARDDPPPARPRPREDGIARPRADHEDRGGGRADRRDPGMISGRPDRPPPPAWLGPAASLAGSIDGDCLDRLARLGVVGRSHLGSTRSGIADRSTQEE